MKHSRLAIHGGEPTVKSPGPHFNWPQLDERAERSLLDQARTSLSIPGNSGVFARFEQDFAKYHGRRHGVLFSSGTAALYAAFVALDLQAGDNVVVPDYTFFATASPLMQFPVDIRFADCDRDGNVHAAAIKNLVDDRTKAVVVTHLWGIPCEIEPIVALCVERGLTLIEDCSHAHGARLNGQLCGSFGQIAVWSLQGQKLISGGEGGILLTDSDEVRDLGLLAGHYNKRCVEQIDDQSAWKGFRTTGFGLKLRAHPLAICLALEQFQQLDQFIAGRTRSVQKFLSLLADFEFVRAPMLQGRQPAWYNLTFTLDEQAAGVSVEKFYSALKSEGCIEADRPGSTRNISTYDLFRKPLRRFGMNAYSSNAAEFRTGAANYAATVLKLPVWTFAAEDDISNAYYEALAKVCTAVRKGEL